MHWRRRAGALLPFALMTLAYLSSVVRVIGLDGLRYPAVLYWRTWQDQGLYVRSASALAAVNLDPAAHYYQLLYPLLGMPFLPVWPSQPFFIVDLLCYLLAFAGFRAVARAFGLPTWGAVLLFAGTTLAQFGFAKMWIEPWTTTPSAALLWLALGAVARLWEGSAPLHILRRGRKGWTSIWDSRTAVVLGLSLGLIPFARPGDTIIAVIVTLSAVAALYRTREVRAAIIAIAAFATAFLLLGTLYVAIYGFAPSPYMRYSAELGFNFAWLGWKAYVLLVDPRAWFGEGIGLLEAAPWLLLGGAGLIAACIWTPAERRPIALTLAAAGVAYTVLMLAYVDLLPSGLWRFNNLHYFKWVLPLFGLFAVRFVLDAAGRPIMLVALVPVLLALTVKLDPVRVADTAPARMVIFPAPFGVEWNATYFAAGSVTDVRGEQRNFFDFHQMLVAGRVRAVALRRPFVGGERWIGDDHVRAQLEGRDTGAYAPLYLTGPWPKTPLARYGMRLSFGLPDWFHGEATAPDPNA